MSYDQSNNKQLLNILAKSLVSIEQGKLIIKPLSNTLVPSDWLKKNSDNIIWLILNATKKNALRYNDYSTGDYQVKQNMRKGGLTMDFSCVLSNKDYYTIFNVVLTRKRNTSKHKAGTPLPNKHFYITKKHDLYKFWTRTKLPKPNRMNSALHDHMGNLKKLLFTFPITEQPSKPDRLTSKNIDPLEISYQEIKIAADTWQTTFRQQTDNSPTNITDKEIAQNRTSIKPQSNQHTCKTKYDKSLQGNAYTSESKQTPPEEQTNEEWLADYKTPNCV